MVDFYEASNDYDRYDSVEHEADFEPVFDAIAGTIDDARDADKGTPLSPDDLNTNIRLALDGLLPRAMEYLKEGKNIEFIDIPDISSLDTEIQEKIPQYLQSKILTHDNELGAPLEKLARILPSFFTCFGEQLPDLDKELAMLKRSRLESGNGKMSTLEIRYHKLRQHASALCQHIPGVFRLLDTVKDNPTHFTPWKLWEDRERTARRIGLSVTADEQKIGLRTIAEFSKKSEPEKKELMVKEPELASMLKMNSLMNLASWEERSVRQKLVPTLLTSAKELQTAMQLTQGSAKNLRKTVWMTGKERGLYTPAGDSLERRAYLLAKKIEIVSFELEKLAGMLAGGKKILPPDAMLQEYGDDTGTFRVAVQEVKTEARVFFSDPLPGVIKAAKNKVIKVANKITYKAEFASMMPEQEEAILRVCIILSDRLQHLRRNVAIVELDSLSLQLAMERKEVVGKLPGNVLPDTTLDSALRNAPAVWQENIEQKKSDLQKNLGQMRTLPEKNERQHFLNALRDMLSTKSEGSTLPDAVRDFRTSMESWVSGMGDIEDAMTEQTADMLAAPGEFRVCLTTWRKKLGQYNADVKAALAKHTGRSAGNANRITMIAKGLAESLQEYKQEYLQELSPAERKNAGEIFDTLTTGIMVDYAPLLAKKSDSKGVSFLQHFENEMKNAAKGGVIYPTTMTQILAGMKGLDVSSREWALKQLVRRGFFRHIIRGASIIPELFSLPVRLVFRTTIRGTMTAVITIQTIRKGNKGIRMGQGGAGRAHREFLVRMVKEGGLKTLISTVPGLALLASFRAVQLELDDGKPPIIIALDRVKDTVREIPWQLLDWATRESVSALPRAALRKIMESLYGDESSLTAQEEENMSQKLTAIDELNRIALNNHRLAGLARRLRDNARKDSDIVILRSNQCIRSHYDLKERNIRLSADATDGEILHEIAHAMTAHQLLHGPRLGLQENINKLNDLCLKAAAAYTGNDPIVKYYLGDLNEFVAGLYSGNDEFIAHLKSITVGGGKSVVAGGEGCV